VFNVFSQGDARADLWLPLRGGEQTAQQHDLRVGLVWFRGNILMDLRSRNAFWPIKKVLIASYTALTHDESCDVAVIGDGISESLVVPSVSPTAWLDRNNSPKRTSIVRERQRNTI
jgi:hypothetical protein